MIKELEEALKNLKTAPSFMGGNSRYKGTTQSSELYLLDISIIEQALQRLDKYEEILKDRITIKIKNPQYSNDYDILCAHSYHILNKLGKLEDIYEEKHKNE